MIRLVPPPNNPSKLRCFWLPFLSFPLTSSTNIFAKWQRSAKAKLFSAPTASLPNGHHEARVPQHACVDVDSRMPKHRKQMGGRLFLGCRTMLTRFSRCRIAKLPDFAAVKNYHGTSLQSFAQKAAEGLNVEKC